MGNKALVTAARFLWGWGGVRTAGRVRPAAAARGQGLVFRGPRPPRSARRSGVTLASPWLRAVRRLLWVDPTAVPGVGLGEVGALLALGARAANSSRVGSSQQNWGSCLRGNLGRGSEADEGAPLDFGGSLEALPSGSTPGPIYSCSAKRRRRGCGGEHGPCLPSGA